MYKISIIVPIFNVEKYIKQCFDSFLAQTIGFSNIQIILVDDCSTDNSLEIIDKYAKDYDNVISLHLHENSGAPGRPRNEGMKFAFADYLLFMDADDILMPKACEVMYNKITESKVDIITAGYKKQDWISNWKSILEDDETLIENPKENLSIFYNPPGLGAKLFKKEFIFKNNMKFHDYLPIEDLLFLTESYLKANSILSLNNFIAYEYRVRNDENNKSITQNMSKEFMLDILEAYSMVFDLLEKFNIDNLLRKLYFTKNHFNFFRIKLNETKLSEDELSELFSSEQFLKYRNQKFIHDDEELNNFFNQLVENHESAEGRTLQLICRQTKNDIMNSNKFSPEITYRYSEKNILENNSIDSIEKTLYSFIKKNAKLYNAIEDSKK